MSGTGRVWKVTVAVTLPGNSATVITKDMTADWKGAGRSIPLLACCSARARRILVVEYLLKDISKPIGVSAYQITNNLPEEPEKQLPSVWNI